MIDLFEQEEAAILFIDKITEKYKRYVRDQFMVLEKSIQHTPKNGMRHSHIVLKTNYGAPMILETSLLI